jgi:hypothetical protein
MSTTESDAPVADSDVDVDIDTTPDPGPAPSIDTSADLELDDDAFEASAFNGHTPEEDPEPAPAKSTRKLKVAGKSTAKTAGKAKAAAKTGAKAPANKRLGSRNAPVKGAGEGATLTPFQRRTLDEIRTTVAQIEGLKKRESDAMWKVAKAVAGLLEGDDKNAPMTGMEVTQALGYDSSTLISVWAKTWRLYGDPDKRVQIAGKEISFNDHTERARISQANGEVKDKYKDLVAAADDLAKEKETSFSTALREVKGRAGGRAGGSTRMTVSEAADRIKGLAATFGHFDDNETPREPDVLKALDAFEGVVTGVAALVEVMEAAQLGFTDAAKAQALQLRNLSVQLLDRIG